MWRIRSKKRKKRMIDVWEKKKKRKDKVLNSTERQTYWKRLRNGYHTVTMRDRPKQSERDRNLYDWVCFRNMEKGLVSARPHVECFPFSLNSHFSKPLLEVRTEAVWHMLNGCLFRNCLLTTGTKLSVFPAWTLQSWE